MKREIITGLSIITLLLSGCGAKEADAYTNAMRSIEAGDYVTAGSLLNKAMDEGTNHKLVYRAEGLAYLGKGDYTEAISSFGKALTQSNGIVEDTDIDISYYMAVAFYKAGQVDESIKTLESIIALKPDYDTPYYLRGKIRLIGGDKDGAMSDYNKAIELAPNNFDHYIRIYEDLRDCGYDNDSNEYIEKAMSSSGKMNAYRKGMLEYYLGSYTDARNDLEDARKSEKGDNLLLYLGKTYEALGDAGYAQNIYEEAIAANPHNGKIANQLALLKMNQKDYQGALEVINQALEQGDCDGKQNLMYNRVAACEYMYDFKGAASYIEEYLNNYPNDVSAQKEYVFLRNR